MKLLLFITLNQHLLSQRHIPGMNFLSSRGVTSGEVETIIVMFQEQRFKMRQCVLFTKQAPDAVFELGITGVELNCLQSGKLFNQGFVDNEVLVAVLPWGLVLMVADALPKELGHPEVRIAKYGGYAYNRGNHLSIERTAAVANQQVGFLAVNQFIGRSGVSTSALPSNDSRNAKAGTHWPLA